MDLIGPAATYHNHGRKWRTAGSATEGGTALVRLFGEDFACSVNGTRCQLGAAPSRTLRLEHDDRDLAAGQALLLRQIGHGPSQVLSLPRLRRACLDAEFLSADLDGGAGI